MAYGQACPHPAQVPGAPRGWAALEAPAFPVLFLVLSGMFCLYRHVMLFGAREAAQGLPAAPVPRSLLTRPT